MINNPENLKYTKAHVWLEFIDDNNIRTGITDYAQEELNEIVFVNLPKPGQVFSIGEAFADLESVKVVSDVICPVNGKVISVNKQLSETPDNINDDPFGSWIAVFSDVKETDELMSQNEYREYCETL